MVHDYWRLRLPGTARHQFSQRASLMPACLAVADGVSCRRAEASQGRPHPRSHLLTMVPWTRSTTAKRACYKSLLAQLLPRKQEGRGVRRDFWLTAGLCVHKASGATMRVRRSAATSHVATASCSSGSVLSAARASPAITSIQGASVHRFHRLPMLRADCGRSPQHRLCPFDGQDGIP